MNNKLKISNFLFLPQRGDFKGADPLNLLKIFGRAFYKKLVGVSGVKPLTFHFTRGSKGRSPFAGFEAVPQSINKQGHINHFGGHYEKS